MMTTNRIPVILQKEKNQCGSACLLMILRFAGINLSLRELSRNFNYDESGVTAQKLIEIADQYKVNSRLVRFKPWAINELNLPCILHWGHNHFVVLKEIKNNHYLIHDPQRGRIKLTPAELKKSLTGYALEFSFQNQLPKIHKSDINLKNIISNSKDVKMSLIKVSLVTIFVQMFSALSPISMQILVDSKFHKINETLTHETVVIGLSLILLANVIIIFSREKMLLDFATQLSNQIGIKTFTKLFDKSLQYFKSVDASEPISKFLSIEPIRIFLTQTMIKVIVGSTTAFICVILMFYYQPLMAITSITFILLYVGWKIITYGFISDLSFTNSALTIKSNSILFQNIESLQSQKIYGVEKIKREEWISNFKHLTKTMRSSGQWALNNKIVYQLLFGIETIITIFLSFELYNQGQLTIGELFAYFALKIQFFNASINLIDEYFSFKLLEPHIWNIDEIISERDEQVANHHTSTPAKRWYKNSIITCAENKSNFMDPVIEMINGELIYEDGTLIFSGINIKIYKDDIVAIDGESGCGKSSLLNCFAGVQKLTNGKMKFKDLTISGYEQRQIKIGTVLQNDRLFSGSILENISCFEMTPDHRRVQESLELAGIYSEIEKFPYGIHSPVGGTQSSLSSGQKVRLLLARAIYTKPEIFIIDEVISNVGNRKAKEIEENILSLKTPIIFSSHQSFLAKNRTKTIFFNPV